VSIRAASADFDATMRLYAHQLSTEELRFGYHLHTAAQKLDVSTEWFKKTIPCTGYTSDEQGDGSTVHSFRYQKEIVDTLCRMMDHGCNVAGLEYIAQTCCEGDLDWARDITGSLRDRWSERHPLQSIPASSST
jgi:hypothetical protein